MRWWWRLNENRHIMKKVLIHATPVLLSFIYLFIINYTINPITLKGPYFLKFYLILILGFYASVFMLKIFGETISKITFYFLISIFLLGIVKLIKGIFLEKPVGFLMMILIIELIVMLIINVFRVNHKMK
ncbi:hypothetical protein ASG22_10560 [Chryseobacterium sp. Leaf405]|nr:hypothetical protein ASG22_10560 [Chryseobacterium sp. Leaf405]